MFNIINKHYRKGLATFVFLAVMLVGCSRPEAPQGQPPVVEVATTTVTPRTVPAVYPFIARIDSAHKVKIVARVDGFLESIGYHEGGQVREGQILFQIDRKPFQAEVAAAAAQVQINESQLWLVRSRLKRIQSLEDRNAISKTKLEDAIGAEKSTAAALQLAEAKLEQAKLYLSYTTLTAPLTGVSGEAKVRSGSYITAGTVLTYVAGIDPAWVIFSISQNAQADAIKEVKSGRLLPPGDGHYTVEVEMNDGSRYPHTGLVNFSAPSFSSKTGTFQVRAEIANPDGDLRPGMFVTAYLTGASRPNMLAVPQKAVQQTANGHVVHIADAEGRVDVRPVTVGDWVGSDWIITQGLKAGEQVIVDGFMQLSAGMRVKPVTPGKQTTTRPVAGR